MEKRSYITLTDGWIDSVWFAAGVPVQLTEVQAKYYLLAGSIAPDEPKPAPAPRARRKGRA